MGENIRQALTALRGNWVRSLLTMAIIAFGIMAVVGILTAIDSAIYSLASNFSDMGANSLTIRAKNADLRGRRGGRAEKAAEPISYDEATAFEDAFADRATVAIELVAAGSAVVKHADEETNPTITVLGIDEDYLGVKALDLEFGRNFTRREVRLGADVAIVGEAIVDKLFGGRAGSAPGQLLTVGNLRLQIVGVLASKGSSMGGGSDSQVLLPLQTARRAYGTSDSRYDVSVQLAPDAVIASGVSEATGAMRVARGLTAREDNDFEIETSDSLLEQLEENTSKLQIGAVAIGIMTLFGAAIGLMNIMLVSVTERTREIGIAKSLGASRSAILTQFLTEAVVVTQIGGVIGIFGGMLAGNVVTLFLGGSFLVPWAWIAASFVVCLLTGLAAGLYPAIKASRLDPIESLRYE